MIPFIVFNVIYTGEIDPIRDLEIISKELRLKDLEWVEKSISNTEKEMQKNRADKARLKIDEANLAILERVCTVLYYVMNRPRVHLMKERMSVT